MITSSAKVASPAAIPFRRISGIETTAATSAATTPPISVARAAPKCACAMNFGSNGCRTSFWSGGITNRAAV